MGKCYGLVRYGNKEFNIWTPPLEFKGEYKCNNQYFGNPMPGASSDAADFEKMTGLCDGSSKGKQIAIWRKKDYDFCEDKCSTT